MDGRTGQSWSHLDWLSWFLVLLDPQRLLWSRRKIVTSHKCPQANILILFILVILTLRFIRWTVRCRVSDGEYYGANYTFLLYPVEAVSDKRKIDGSGRLLGGTGRSLMRCHILAGHPQI